MKFEELRFICEEAAKGLISKGERPVPATIVLPGADRTRLLKLGQFPQDDEARHALIAQFAKDQVTANAIPCWGFVVEAEVADHEAIVIVYGARKHAPEISAAPLVDDELGVWAEAEELDPTAMPFLHPLQHAVDALPALDGEGGGDAGGDDFMLPPAGGLPIVN